MDQDQKGIQTPLESMGHSADCKRTCTPATLTSTTRTHTRTHAAFRGVSAGSLMPVEKGSGCRSHSRCQVHYNFRRLPGRRSPPSRGLCAQTKECRTSQLNFTQASCSRMATGHVLKSRMVRLLSPHVSLPTQGRDVTPLLQR